MKGNGKVNEWREGNRGVYIGEIQKVLVQLVYVRLYRCVELYLLRTWLVYKAEISCFTVASPHLRLFSLFTNTPPHEEHFNYSLT